jgi:hypothetical protein
VQLHTRIVPGCAAASAAERSPGDELSGDIAEPWQHGEREQPTPDAPAPEHRQKRRRGEQRQHRADNSGGTELPETINGVLWVRSRQDSLAFGNVAGSATFQACILGFIGVTFTSWQPGPAGVVSAILTLLTASALLALLWRGRVRGWLLALTVLPWLGYVAAQLITGGTLGG